MWREFKFTLWQPFWRFIQCFHLKKKQTYDIFCNISDMLCRLYLNCKGQVCCVPLIYMRLNQHRRMIPRHLCDGKEVQQTQQLKQDCDDGLESLTRVSLSYFSDANAPFCYEQCKQIVPLGSVFCLLKLFLSKTTRLQVDVFCMELQTLLTKA